MIAYHQSAIDDLKELKMVGGATGFNMIRCIEEYIYMQADHDVEWAIGARNAIEKLSRSSDKKSGGKTDKDEPSTPK